MLNNEKMTTIDVIHKANLQLLAAEFKGVSAVAAKIGISSSQYSQWMNGSQNSGTGKPRGMRPASARRIEAALGKPIGWMDTPHPAEEPEQDRQGDDDGFAPSSPDMTSFGQRVGIGESSRTVPIRAVKIKVQAGSDGYVTEPDFDIDHGYFQVPAEVIETLGVDPSNLIVTTFRGRSMEPMYFDGGQGLVDVSKRKPVNNECFVVNWNGETLVKCLIKKSDGWCLYSFNRDYPSISVRDGYCSIIGMVVWQPARIVKGLL